MTFVRSPAPEHLADIASRKVSHRPQQNLNANDLSRRYETLDVALDAARKLFWCRLRPAGRSCFTPALLRDVAAMQRDIPRLFAGGPADPDAPVRWFACASAIPGVFTLGGALGLFQTLIGRGDLDGLRRYGHAAAEAIHRNHVAMDLPVVTIALVQGDALGGG